MAFYLVSMLPVIGIIRVGPQSLSDHHLYVPAIGIFVLVVWGISDLLSGALLRSEVAVTLGALVIISYAIATASYLPSWGNSFTLFSRAERLSPSANDLIENNLGQGLTEPGKATEAIPHYRLAIYLAPGMPLPHCSLGNALVATGDPNGAVAEFQLALDRSPSGRLKAQCLNNLGVAQLILRRADLAERSFAMALQTAPSDQHSLAGRGAAWFQLGKLNEAEEDLRRSLAIGPDPLAYYWLGKTLTAKNEREGAIMAFKSALAIAPGQTASQIELDKLTQGEALP
jgi:tetratricopeptide (TPR) repeat protein